MQDARAHALFLAARQWSHIGLGGEALCMAGIVMQAMTLLGIGDEKAMES
jgi:hypothetical protein